MIGRGPQSKGSSDFAHKERRPPYTFVPISAPVSGRIAIACWLGLLFGVSSPPAAALDPQRPLSQALLRIWQVQQGLPRAAINSIHQTGDGYLWLGTQSGLYRFDGVRFVPGIPEQDRQRSKPWIQAVCEDRDRQLWLATDDAGLIRLGADGVTTFGLAEGLPSEQVRCLLVDRQGDLWAGTHQGLARFQNGKFQVYGVSDGLPNKSIRALSESPEGALWVGVEGPRVCVFDGKNFDALEERAFPLQGTINAIHAGTNDSLWVGTTAGLVRRIGGQLHPFTATDRLGSDVVYCLTPGRRGEMWAGTKEGLCRIQGEEIERFETRDGLSQSTVYSLCEDHEGSLWVGTKHGLNQFVDRRTLLPFTTSEGLPSNNTGPILQDRTGAIWVGTLDAGLARFDRRQFASPISTDLGLHSNRVLSLADAHDKGIWIGTEQGLCRYSNSAIVERLSTVEGLPSNAILSLCTNDQEGLWVGTAAGLAECRNGQVTQVVGDDDLAGRPVSALCSPDGQRLFAALEGKGLCELIEGKLRSLAKGEPEVRNIDSLYVDDQNRLWMSLRGHGLGLLEQGAFHSFGVKDGLFDDDIFGMASDDQGRLWMACSRGIFSVPIADLQKFSRGEITHLTTTPFSPTDAQRTIECQNGVQPAVWKMKDGRIWFSTIRGIIVVDPQGSRRRLPSPKVLVEEIRLNGEEVSPQELKRLGPGRNNLHFHYTSLSFVSPSRVAFRYQLEGYDKEWIEAGSRREAFYTNLPPGSYRFRVQAVNSDGTFNETAQPVTFTLPPFFYQRSWFLPLVILSLAGAAWLSYKWRIRQIKSRLQAVLAERSRIARELHDTLIQGFSGVTMQMQALTARLRESPERQTLTEIIRDAGGCLSQARRSVAGLRSSGEANHIAASEQNGGSGLPAAMARAAKQLTETSDVELRLRISPMTAEFHPDVEYNLLRIVQEAIANALKHSGGKSIELTMQVQPRQLQISVKDDGIGFDVAHHLAHVQTGHYGLIGMRERAAQIGAEISWVSEPKKGTTVTIRRPLSSSLGASMDQLLRRHAAQNQTPDQMPDHVAR